MSNFRGRYLGAVTLFLGLCWQPISQVIEKRLQEVYADEPSMVIVATIVSAIIYGALCLLIVQFSIKIFSSTYFKSEFLRRIYHADSYIEGVWINRIRNKSGELIEVAIVIIHYRHPDRAVMVDGDAFLKDNREFHFSSEDAIYNEESRMLRFSYHASPLDENRSSDVGIARYKFLVFNGVADGFDGSFSDAGRSVVHVSGERIRDAKLRSELARTHESRRDFALRTLMA